MREYQSEYTGYFAGLRPTDRTPVNSTYLIKSVGGFADIDGFKTLNTLDLMQGITDLGEVFPFPQIMFLRSCTLVCGKTKIWEYLNGSYILKISGLSPGTIWTVADFQNYVLLTNGVDRVARNPSTFAIERVTDELIPVGSSYTAHKGQLIITCPNYGINRNTIIYAEALNGYGEIGGNHG